jgi:hypothetical protein
VKEKLRSLNNIAFLTCLALLLLNDFYLKGQFHNALTGKLSDFCGLFVFALFWSTFFHGRKAEVYFSTAFIFVIWKSPYSQPFIDLFSRTFYPISRTVDLTDLMALIILPIGFFYNAENQLKTKINPFLLTVISFMAFCATSIPYARQQFVQPQYVLFKSGIVDFVDSDYPSVFNVYRLDTLIVVGVQEIRIDRHPPLDDEFHKKQILADLDVRLLKESLDENGITGRQSYYLSIKDSLTVHGRTAVTLKLDSVTDELNFHDTRLHGKFKRLSENNQLMIEGTFRNGIEDSIWTFYDHSNKIVSRKYFQNGELIRTETIENSNIISKQEHNTRSETVRNKYFHLAIICVILISLLTKLVLNFRRSQQKDIIEISFAWLIICIIALPVVVLLLAKVISSLIPSSYPNAFFGIFFEAFYIYVFTAPLFLIVLRFVKLRNKFDLITYVLVFSLTVVLVEEWSYLKDITP